MKHYTRMPAILEVAVIPDTATTDHEHDHGGFPDYEFLFPFKFDHSSLFKRPAVPAGFSGLSAATARDE